MSISRIFCDLDGVLADFDTGLSLKCGRNVSQMDQVSVWKLMNVYPDIFANLPLMPEAQYLWSSLLPYQPVILSGCPRAKKSREAKIVWCNKYLGTNFLQVKSLEEIDANPGYDYYIILTGTKHKPQFATNGSILIDDRQIINEEWEEKGGIFFHYDGSNATHIIKTIKKWS